MLAGIYVCIFETKPTFTGINICGLDQVLLIIEIPELCLQVFFFAILIQLPKLPNKSLANVNEFTAFVPNRITMHFCPML